MKINLWKPGELRYNKTDINIGDHILVRKWEGDIVGGDVLELTPEHEVKMHITHVTSIDDFYQTNKDSYIDLDEIYGIDVVLTAEQTEVIKRATHAELLKNILVEFNEKYNFILWKDLEEKDFEHLLDIYSSNVENRNYLDTIFNVTVKSPLYNILEELTKKYSKPKYNIDLGLLQQGRTIEG
jgi:hypothetical protein